MYKEETGNAASYIQISPTEAIWDDGDSEWDYNGNIYASQWDIVRKSYVEASNNTVSLTEQSGNAAIYAEQSGNTVIWTEQ